MLRVTPSSKEEYDKFSVHNLKSIIRSYNRTYQSIKLKIGRICPPYQIYGSSSKRPGGDMFTRSGREKQLEQKMHLTYIHSARHWLPLNHEE